MCERDGRNLFDMVPRLLLDRFHEFFEHENHFGDSRELPFGYEFMTS